LIHPKTKTLIVVAGPTAVGKTTMAIRLAQELQTEIISADSRQFYREMKIGTAMPDENQLALVPHHFIGNLSIHDYYNVFKFEQEALQRIDSLFVSHDFVVVVGGSGLYIKTLCEGIDEMPDAVPEIRNELNEIFEKEGIEALRLKLKKLDPEGYQKIDIANPKRLIRALEVCLTAGKTFSQTLTNKKLSRPFSIIKIGLKRERQELYNIINQRVDAMMEAGLEREAESLFSFKHLNALNTVGYRELFQFFEGNFSRHEAIEKIKTNTRRYAKKQMTWFSADSEVHWSHPEDVEMILHYIQSIHKL
jgi:tRNA dimethylallyltransferase